jgi:predicted Zn-dependent protease
LVKQDSGNEKWREDLAHQQVRLGTIREMLGPPGNSTALARKGLAVLKALADQDQASPLTLDLAVSSTLSVEPPSLRDPKAAVVWAERGVALSRRRTPEWLLLLAQAYHTAGEIEKGRLAAAEGLALLPTLQSGATKPRIRKLLEMEARKSG